MAKPRVVFAGTPAFARASLAALVAAGVVPVAVLTQPDRPAGRGRRLTMSPVKAFAEAAGIEVLQPPTLKDAAAVQRLAALEPDLIVVAAYGLLLPESVLGLPAKGCLNVHASLLPRWRGAAPIQAAILAGDRESGVCLMQMEAGLDTGPVYAEARVGIGPATTAGELHDQLAARGGELLVAELDGILAGAAVATPQDDVLATYAPKIAKADARIDWTRPASEIDRAVRAYNPYPGANFGFEDERVKLWRASAESAAGKAPGQVMAVDAAGISVACGDGSLVLTELQRPGRRPVSAAEFAAQVDLDGACFA